MMMKIIDKKRYIIIIIISISMRNLRNEMTMMMLMEQQHKQDKDKASRVSNQVFNIKDNHTTIVVVGGVGEEGGGVVGRESKGVMGVERNILDGVKSSQVAEAVNDERIFQTYHQPLLDGKVR